MKIKLLDINKFTKGLVPVITTELKTRTGEFHPNGLFSEKIFGIEGSLERSKTFSFIELNANIIHPAAFKLLIRLDRRIELFLNTEKNYSLDSNDVMIEDEKGVSGTEEFIKLFPKMKIKTGTPEREKLVKVIKDSYKDNILFVNRLPVIPPELRPMYDDESGRTIMDELNNIYLNIMRKASQVKGVGKRSALYNLLNFYLQRSVNDHDQYIRSKISKKHGLIRENMLGKRVDFSARGVITPGPDLKVNEIGVPLRIAVTLFQPFLIHYLLFSNKYPFRDELAEEVKKHTDNELSVDTINRVIKSIKLGDKISKKLYDLIFNSIDFVMKGRVVLTKRDPALHAGSYRAFKPILIHGDVIQISTLHVGSFNADFDGDQMALFHPLSKQAQEEAKTKMMRAMGGNNTEHRMYAISKEMLVGLYIMTKNIRKTNSPIGVNQEILEKATDPYIQVRFRNRVTTMGRAIFNNNFPEKFDFIDQVLDKKIVNNLILKSIKELGEEETNKIFSKIEKLGFKFATIMAPTISIDMIEMPPSILRIKDKLEDSSPTEADKLLKEAEKIMIEHLKDTGIYDLIQSGSGKGWSQPRQILVAKGVIADPKGNVLPPIKGSFSDGLSATEYFAASAGARKGMADRALNTADTGYFTRQLVYVLGPCEASPNIRDCKTKRTVTIRLTSDYIKRLKARYIIRGDRIESFNPSVYKPGDVIRLRTPIFCESHKICHTCYGDLLKIHRTPYIGILAGSSIGERGTQLVMQTFHTGGAANIATQNIFQDIIDNDPLIKVNLNNYLSQDEDKLVTKKSCKIKIDLTNYDMNNNIQINKDHIWCNHLLSTIEYDDVIFNMILDYPVNLKKFNIEIIEKQEIILSFNPNETILEVPFQITEIKQQVNYVGRLLGGKVVYKDPSHLIGKVMKIYGPVSDLDLVHFEVLISQVLRDKVYKMLPARLGRKWDPVLVNIKNAVFQSGFLQGLAFENVNKAIEMGMISEGELEPSLLGRLITGEIIK